MSTAKLKNKVKKILNTNLKFEISNSFKEINSSHLKKVKKNGVFARADDKRVVIDTKRILSAYAGGILSIIGLLLVFFLFPAKELSQFPGIIFLSIPLLVLILSIIYGFTLSKQYIILDRENGLFTYPRKFYGKPFTIHFEDAVVYWVGTGGASGNLDMKLAVAYPENKYLGTYLSAHIEPYYEIWSFYVWYMDKNRPLPPGDAFDSYREQDYKRRKAEGFPPPLFKSYIPTPEAGEKQQIEREQFWKEKFKTDDKGNITRTFWKAN